MTNIQELIETAEKLCQTLDLASQQEKIFTTNICIELERLSWTTLTTINDLKQINDYVRN